LKCSEPLWGRLSSPESQTPLSNPVVLMPLRGKFFVLLFYFSLLLSFFIFSFIFSSLILCSFILFSYFDFDFDFFLKFDSCTMGNNTLRKRTIAPPGAIVRRSLLNSAVDTEEANICPPLGDRSPPRHVPKDER
jgi:hypothetical protein